ncbi:MAG: hypothetical protein GY757_00070 [bacterium]|nr:hypothetical protein [bacterium]
MRQLEVKPKANQKEEIPTRISLLINSIYFFIESVLIVEQKNLFRLLAIHQNRILVDETYKTAKGAKIAFLKFFSYKGWRDGTRADWSPFYPPNSKWLNSRVPAKKKNINANIA